MALILNIDTATELASVCLMENEELLAYAEHSHQKEHATFITSAIKDMLNNSGLTINDIDAFSVCSGPGSYTGLRVGLSTAKGFCYATSKPLILINTLKVMASAALATLQPITADDLFCPMIDARRMEVFTAVFDNQLNYFKMPAAVILEDGHFLSEEIERNIYFFGSGSEKFKNNFPVSDKFHFISAPHNAVSLGQLAIQSFDMKEFANLSLSTPEYIKEFHHS